MWLSSVHLLLLMYVRIAPCEWYAATQKHGKCDGSFADTPYFFSAMVFETLGAINAEGEEILRMLFCFASKRMVESLLLIVAAHGPAYHATCNVLCRKPFSR